MDNKIFEKLKTMRTLLMLDSLSDYFEVPEGHIVMSATRPLVGAKIIDDSKLFFGGRHFAIIDPKDEAIDYILDKNRSLDANLILEIDFNSLEKAIIDRLNPNYQKKIDEVFPVGSEKRTQYMLDKLENNFQSQPLEEVYNLRRVK